MIYLIFLDNGEDYDDRKRDLVGIRATLADAIKRGVEALRIETDLYKSFSLPYHGFYVIEEWKIGSDQLSLSLPSNYSVNQL